MSLLDFLCSKETTFSLIFFIKMVDKSDDSMYFSLNDFPFGIGFESDLILTVIPRHEIKKVLNDLNLVFLIGKMIGI